MPPVVLLVQNICKAFGDETLLDDVSLQVRAGERVGLIGPNGSGKTTLFRIITGREAADTGEVIIPKGVRAGMLAQDEGTEGTGTAIEEMLASREDLARIATRMHRIEEALSVPDAHLDAEEHDRVLREHARLAEEYHHLGGENLEGEARRILRGIGLGPEVDDRPAAVLSGGQKRRLALAKLLLAAPDLMLLDEPTNHLDLAAITWLEDYLRAFRGGVLIVSHDRFLLDAVANHVCEIEDTRLRQFDGNYSAYHAKKEADNAAIAKRADSMARERARLEESAQRLFTFRQFTRMRSVQKQIWRLEQVARAASGEKTRMRFAASRRSGKEVLAVEDMRKRFGAAPLLEGVSFTVWRGDRVALIGGNGTGKTTLLRLILGQLPADAGGALLGHQVDTYYYDQQGENLDPRNTVLQEASLASPHLSMTEVRGALARFLIFAEEAERPISSLSGGERSRVSLARMFLSGANFLILDEPTNHLDIDGKEALEAALADFSGTVLMVSHDRYFLDCVATRVAALEDGTVSTHLGNYSEYLLRRATPLPVTQERMQPPVAAPEGKSAGGPSPARGEAGRTTGRRRYQPSGVGAEPTASSPPGTSRSLDWWRRRQAAFEDEVAAIEAEIIALGARLAAPETHRDGRTSAAVAAEHDDALRALQVAMAGWAEAGHAVEELISAAEEARRRRLGGEPRGG